ncbi:MAG TPA: hypothetical protein PLP30_05970 [Clostridia bacterium]|nr:hypothetical protein [Clostridia bacterium]HRX41489.1 hypothetical protein [Clostridia bacterium]
MSTLMKSSDVRKNWSLVINTVIRNKPVLIRRNQDIVSMMSVEQLNLLLKEYSITMKIWNETDGSVSGSIEELDLLENRKTVQLLKKALYDELIEYCNEYMNEFQLYFHSKDRNGHFPYVQKVLANESRLNDIVAEYHTKDSNA